MKEGWQGIRLNILLMKQQQDIMFSQVLLNQILPKVLVPNRSTN
jgi:hypothetical protein